MGNNRELTEEQKKLVRETVVQNIKLNFAALGVEETEESKTTMNFLSEQHIKELLNGKYPEALEYYLKQNDPYFVDEDTKRVIENAKNGKILDENLKIQVENLIEFVETGKL